VCNSLHATRCNFFVQRDGKYSWLQHFRLINIFRHVRKPAIIAQKLQRVHATIANETMAYFLVPWPAQIRPPNGISIRSAVFASLLLNVIVWNHLFCLVKALRAILRTNRVIHHHSYPLIQPPPESCLYNAFSGPDTPQKFPVLQCFFQSVHSGRTPPLVHSCVWAMDGDANWQEVVADAERACVAGR